MGSPRKSLTYQQEKFAVALAGGATQSDAYRQAYPTSLKWPDAVVWSKASEMARHRLVVERVKEIREPAAVRVQDEIVYTAKVAMSEAQRALELAERVNQPGAMVAAIQLRAKLNGLITEKKEVSVTAMSDMTPSEKGFLLEQAKELIEERRRLMRSGRDDVQDVDPK